MPKNEHESKPICVNDLKKYIRESHRQIVESVRWTETARVSCDVNMAD